MSQWTEVTGPGGHRVQLLEGGGVLWEHDTPPGYRNGSYLIRRHQISPLEGQTWTVTQRDPLTLTPSLHCDPALGGCGAHGVITAGAWR